MEHVLFCRELAGERLKLNREFFDERWSKHRIVTSLDWSTQVGMMEEYCFDLLFGLFLYLSVAFTAELTLSSIYNQFITLKKKTLGKHCGKR